jgi:ureidoglycolate lyase
MAEALEISALNRSGFAPFGDVIEVDERDSFPINNGMAERFHGLAEVQLAGDDARAIISVVASRQYQMPRKVDHLEHHPYGSQAFIPLNSSPFIVVVAVAGDEPVGRDLHAFVTNGRQGINYHKGTWHHVLLTPYAAMRFICVDRAGSGNNCIDFFFAEDQQLNLELP